MTYFIYHVLPLKISKNIVQITKKYTISLVAPFQPSYPGRGKRSRMQNTAQPGRERIGNAYIPRIIVLI